MTPALLTEEFLLVAHPTRRKVGWHGGRLATGVSGAALGELILMGRVGLDEVQPLVADTAPVGHTLLDAMLRDLEDAPKVVLWVHRWAQRAYAHTRDDLVRSGGLIRGQGRLTWLRTEITSVVLDHPVRADALARLDSMTNGSGPTNPRTAMLAGLLYVMSRSSGFPGREGRFTEPAFKDQARESLLAQTVRRAARTSVD